MIIESMLPDEERTVLNLARKLERIREQMSAQRDGEHDAVHFNLPYKVFIAFRDAYRASRNEFDDTKADLKRAIKSAELLSPGCSSELLALAKDTCWN